MHLLGAALIHENGERPRDVQFDEGEKDAIGVDPRRSPPFVPRRRSGLAARAVSSPNEFIASSLTLLTRANELEVPSHPGPMPGHGDGAPRSRQVHTPVCTRVSDLYGPVVSM